MILAGLILILIVSALLYRKLLQHKVAQDRAITSPNGIASLERVRIGGIDEWIEIRGQNVNNPILLFIHGGPGIAFIPLAGDFQGPWEERFTVVEWDQRGAGKTYASNDKELQQRTMNVPQMEQDTLEVVNYLRHRFKREKILIVGHSWGSVLGLWLAHEHPETIYAYVGVGQVVNMEQNARLVYRDELNQARSRRDEQAVKELESIAPYPLPNADERKTLTGGQGNCLGRQKPAQASLMSGGFCSRLCRLLNTHLQMTSVLSAAKCFPLRQCFPKCRKSTSLNSDLDSLFRSFSLKDGTILTAVHR